MQKTAHKGDGGADQALCTEHEGQTSSTVSATMTAEQTVTQVAQRWLMLGDARTELIGLIGGAKN